MVRWFRRVFTARRAMFALLLLVAVLAASAVVAGWSADTSSVVVAAATLAVAVLAWATSVRATDVTERAYRTAVEAHLTAEALARIERDRWHAELTPGFVCEVQRVGTSRQARLVVAWAGPPGLERLDSVVIRIRDDGENHTPQGAGGPSAADLAAHIWGPLRFDVHVNGVQPPGRETQPFAFEGGQTKIVAVRGTDPGPWDARTPDEWARHYQWHPLRLTFVCELAGFRPWYVHQDVALSSAMAP